jgi:hypothetical protein
MFFTLASDPLAAWGQAAAILLVIELFFFILIGLALAAAAMFAVGWVREKAELVKKLRPYVDSVNTTTEAALSGTLPPAQANEDKIVRTVAEIPATVKEVDKKVEKASDRVANAVIEFRARTVQAETILKGFFLPGLARRQLREPLKEKGIGYKSPGLQQLMQEKVPDVPTAPGEGYVKTVTASQIKDASTY